jgi:hypothetical protein
MLFMIQCAMEPRNRDENERRLRKNGIGSPNIEVLGAWLSVTGLEGWVVCEAPDAGALVKFFYNWTDLNVNKITPIMRAEDVLQFAAAAE